jgi:hypothetical protein
MVTESKRIYIPGLIQQSLSKPVQLVLLAIQAAQEITEEVEGMAKSPAEELLLRIIDPQNQDWTRFAKANWRTLRSIKNFVRISEVSYFNVYGESDWYDYHHDHPTAVMVEHKVGEFSAFVFFTVDEAALVGVWEPVSYITNIRHSTIALSGFQPIVREINPF